MLDFACVDEGIPEFSDCSSWLRFAPKNTTHIQIGYTIPSANYAGKNR